MREKFMRIAAIIAVLASMILSMGCVESLRNKQLEKVAKDWALVIRASQVIPVYPLSEDLQPGDVLLVSIPIEEQVLLYKDKGFLPLDQHLVRIYPKDYADFYNSRYGINDQVIPPEQWQRTDAEGKHKWEMAPHAAFPTYQFSVQTGSGLNLAIPVQGIPFALGLMNSGKASGTVTIADAYTFGLDNIRLEEMVRDWAAQHRHLLRNYEPQGEKYHFLRVVSRVYVSGRVSVTVNNDEAVSAEAGAGADRPVTLLGVKEGATKDNYNEAIKSLNDLAEKQLPGGKIKFATASSRSITFQEAFRRPLVIGYVGFDMPILEGGRVGAPVSTLGQLAGRTPVQTTFSDASNVYRLAAISHMYNALEKIKSEKADGIRSRLDTLKKLLPETYPFSLYMRASPTEIKREGNIIEGAKVKGEGFEAVINYLNNANRTIEALEGHLRTVRVDAVTASSYTKEKKLAQDALRDIGDRLNRETVLMEAIDFVFLGY